MTRYDAWIPMAALFVSGILFGWGWKALLIVFLITGFLYGWGKVYDPRKQDKPDPKQEKAIQERNAMWLARAEKEQREKDKS